MIPSRAKVMTMRQYEAVAEAMRQNGGCATFGQLNQLALKVSGVEWKTKTPFASIRRIVQTQRRFFKIRPGLWGLSERREQILKELGLPSDARSEATSKAAQESSHAYYQGLLVEIGNYRGLKTFVPAQDQNKSFTPGKRLGEMISDATLPAFTYEPLIRVAKTVDVVWLNQRGFPDSFWEVEHTTDIYNSLRKFVAFQDFQVRPFIVAAAARQREFAEKRASDAFSVIRDRVKFRDYENLPGLYQATKEVAAADL